MGGVQCSTGLVAAVPAMGLLSYSHKNDFLPVDELVFNSVSVGLASSTSLYGVFMMVRGIGWNRWNIDISKIYRDWFFSMIVPSLAGIWYGALGIYSIQKKGQMLADLETKYQQETIGSWLFRMTYRQKANFYGDTGRFCLIIGGMFLIQAIVPGILILARKNHTSVSERITYLQDMYLSYQFETIHLGFSHRF